MPFARPTLPDLVTRIRGDFRSRLEIEGSLLRRAMADVFAVVWAGAVHLLHGHLEWLGRQLFPTTAEEAFLLADAARYGITKKPATFASGIVTATGTDTKLIPEDWIVVRDDGFTYRVTADATIAGGTADVSVEADLAGAYGNAITGETLSFESPIDGVDSDVTVKAPGWTNGADEEDAASILAQLLLRLQDPPQGGSDQDYEAWALAVSGVTRAWVFENENGLGTVVVRFIRDNDTPSIFPDAGEVAAVQSALDLERPITSDVTAAAPTDKPVVFTISITPDTANGRLAVEAELDDLMQRDAEPGDGLGRGTIFLSRIQTAIGIADGVDDFTMAVPVADVVPAADELATRGLVTWV